MLCEPRSGDQHHMAFIGRHEIMDARHTRGVEYCAEQPVHSEGSRLVHNDERPGGSVASVSHFQGQLRRGQENLCSAAWTVGGYVQLGANRLGEGDNEKVVRLLGWCPEVEIRLHVSRPSPRMRCASAIHSKGFGCRFPWP